MNSYTPQNLWRLQILTSYQAVDAVLNLLENLSLETLSWYECEGADLSYLEDDQGFPIAETFIVEGYSKKQPDLKLIERELQTLAALLAIPQPIIQAYQPVDHQDWLQVCYQQLAPRTVGSYYIYGSHDKDIIITAGLIPLQIDAATAFGSGEHQTTSGCLTAISDLSRQHQVQNILDMGCGSGILAIAAAKIWPSATVMAADNDPESVRVTAYNSHLNNVSIQTLHSEGFANPVIHQHSPYNLVIANILAKPLCHMAKDMRQALAFKGFIILSGLLERQQEEVLNCYQPQGLALVKIYNIENWITLVLQA
jgi:ribosomal protein L11 methyltransferase